MTPETKPVSIPKGEWYIEHLENDENKVFIHIDEPSGAMHEVCETSPELAELICKAVNRDHLYEKLIKNLEFCVMVASTGDCLSDKSQESIEKLLKEAKELSK